ncbi:methyltransferase domain-containing protein [Thermodesulfobacteriota bacterium]
MFKKILTNPQIKNLDIDSSQRVKITKSIIQNKTFLKKIYLEWYHEINSLIPTIQGPILEIGSGGGFLNNVIPQIITSEVFYSSNINLVLNAKNLPFKNNSIKCIVLIDVFHHISQPVFFLEEACRCLCSGGQIVMIEPWYTPWSNFIFSKLHHEPFLPDAQDWSFSATGPLSGANGALPWIVFQRDKTLFEKQFPDLFIKDIKLSMPVRYLLSGGISMRSLMPGWSFSFWRMLENIFNFAINKTAMFALINLQMKTDD